MRELPEKQAESLASFTNLITIANIVNYRLLQNDSTPLDIKPYLASVSDDKVIQDAIVTESLMLLKSKYKEGSNTDYTNRIDESVFEKMASDAGVSKTTLQKAEKNYNLIKYGTQQDIVDSFISENQK